MADRAQHPATTASLGLLSVAGWIVTATMAVWGGSYLYRCFGYVLSPGVPILVEYDAVEGKGRVEAKSYRIDPWKQTARLTSASLRESKGSLVARAEWITARWDGKQFVVETDGLQAQVIRSKDGSFNFSKALPKPSKPGKMPAVEVHARRADVRYVDETAKPSLAKSVRLEQVNLFQQSGDVLVNSLITVDNIRRARVDSQLAPDGKYWLKVAHVDADIASLWPVADKFIDHSTLGEWGEVDFGRLLAKGWIEVSGGKDPVVDLRGSMHLDSPKIRIGKQGVSGSLVADVSGSLGSTAFSATLSEPGRTAKFVGTGRFGRQPAVSGNYELVSSNGKLWRPLDSALPKGTAFHTGKTAGTLSYIDGKLAMRGSATLGSASYSGETLRNVAARYTFASNKLTVGIDHSRWRGGPVAGTFQADLTKQTILGIADLQDRPLQDVLSPFGVDSVRGRGSAKALVRGTFQKPNVELLAKGNADVKLEDGSFLHAGTFEARASIDGTQAKVHRLVVSGPNGVLAASGFYDLKTHGISGEVMAGALPLSTLNQDLEGTAFLTGKVKGTTSKPSYNARFEAYGASYKDKGVAQIVGEIHGDKSQLELDSIKLLSGTGTASGKGRLDLQTHALTGGFSAQNIALSSYLGEDVFGTVQVANGTVGGTLKSPIVSAEVTSQKLTAFGLSLDSVRAPVQLKNDVLTVENAVAMLHGASINASAHYSLQNEKAQVHAVVQNLALSDLLLSSDELSVSGTASGQVDVVSEKGAVTGNGNVDLSNVTVNGSPLGSGSLALRQNGETTSVTGDIGSVDRYLSFNNLDFNAKEKSFKADIAAYNLRLNDVILATRPYWQASWTNPPEWLAEADGSFSGLALLSANSEGWTLGPSDLSLDNLRVAGRDAGKLTAHVSHDGSRLQIPDVSWTSGDFSMQGTGWLDDNGQLDLKASLTDFDLTWVNTLFPEAPLVTGTATATVVAAGSKDDPTGRASLLINRAIVTNRDGKSVSDPIQLLIDNVTFGNKRVAVTGQAAYSGFTGQINAIVPYSALNQDAGASREPLSASLTFDERPLTDFKDHVQDIDYDKSVGTVKLTASVNGYAEDLKVSANAIFDAPKLVLRSFDTPLRDVKFTYDQNGRRANVDLQATSGIGGTIASHITANLAHVFGSDFDVDALLDDSTVTGEVKADKFLLSQKVAGAKEATTGMIDGGLALSGSLRNPVIGGDVGLEQLVIRLPEEVVAGAAGSIPIDPTFSNVNVRIGSGSRIETALGPLVVRGNGMISGSLSDPAVNVPLTLESGNFRLPSGRIALEPGGSIVLSYNSLAGGDPIPRVDLDLEGHTTVIARSGTGQYEPFRIILGIQGNALDENNLRLTAYSDPPDLSQDEILALIGQRDLIEGLAAGVLGGNSESSRLRDAFYSIAVPSFSQNLTQGIASGLHLDYLTVDYNPFDQVILSAGKTIGKGLVLQVTRQLQGTEFGPLRYEVKLVYRLPVADRFLSRVTLGLGFDQNVPIKLTLNWSKRF